MNILEISSVTKRFFGFEAISNVSAEVRKGEILALIGPNGSGKTTLFNCITGFLRPESGQIQFNGVAITGRSPHIIARLGIARTFQLVRVFPNLSVLDNMLIAIQDHQERSFFSRVMRSPRVKQNEKFAKERATNLLNFVGLEESKNVTAKSLSYGQRKLLTFVIAIMPEPELILLDEPAAAVNPTMINNIKQYIRDLKELGITIFLVEHNMDVVMDLADRIIVLDHGTIIAEGPPREIRNDENVIEAYFGR